jgi:type I restriction enzyme S subunit
MSEDIKIPKGWKLKKLGEVCKLKNGYAFKSDKYENKGVPVIRISDINGGIVSGQKSVRVKAYEDYENYLVENNDILVAMSGATTGKFGIYKSTEKAYQNQRVGKFQILDKSVLNNEFLLHQINSLKRQIEKDAYGGAQPNISSAKIEQMEVVLPLLPEQQAIVSKIEELFSELENGIAQLKTAQQRLKVYRQSLLKWAFEGKLTNKKVKDGELPKGWKLLKLSDLGTWKGGGTPSKQVNKYWENGTNLWVSSKDMKIGVINDSINKITDEAILNSSANRIPKGAILFVMRSGILRHTFPVAIAGKDLTVNQDLQTLTPNGLATSEFIYWFIIAFNNEIRQTCSKDGTTVESIESISLKNYPFILPPLSEQQLIVDELESKLTVCDKIEETISQSLLQAETLRQSILKMAFEGKLVTT